MACLDTVTASIEDYSVGNTDAVHLGVAVLPFACPAIAHFLWLSPDLAHVPDAEQVWVVSTVAPLARCYGPGGVLATVVGDLPLSGLDRALGLEGGGALLVAPGALLELDRHGEIQNSQGGFDFLVDLARVRVSPTSATPRSPPDSRSSSRG